MPFKFSSATIPNLLFAITCFPILSTSTTAIYYTFASSTMDFVKKAAESVKGNSGSGQNPPAEGGQKQDYVDKAFSMGAKKSGHNINPGTQEKMTDAGRTAYEKVTGSKVDPKISN
ncbi:hypothetical protein E4U24_000943 [Claviceps purpurea]|nr:hypothetical protein E4U27_008258 [Claviceps purpurea]KAG6252006.1 hypothetical protein E4U24_000943 [Claviceps purpurea]KAG6292091.1 hypothetical protein E4U45_007021 [Claviceps purpurea]KAG6311574.1 hypothetical protein E4U44_004161 [Claviceps purpurea]